MKRFSFDDLKPDHRSLVEKQINTGKKVMKTQCDFLSKISRIQNNYLVALKETIREESETINNLNDQMMTRRFSEAIIKCFENEHSNSMKLLNLQREALEEIETIKSEINEMVKVMIKNKNKDAANKDLMKNAETIERRRIDFFISITKRMKETHQSNLEMTTNSIETLQKLITDNENSDQSISNFVSNTIARFNRSGSIENTESVTRKSKHNALKASKKIKKRKKNLFEMTFEDLCELKENGENKVPKIIRKCCKAIERMGGFNEEGIFRISCKTEELAQAKSDTNNGDYSFEKFNSPHVPAALLKTLLKEIKTPLIPNQMVEHCAKLGGLLIEGIEIEENTMEDFFKNLPKNNRDVIRYISMFLMRLKENESKTRMNMHNFAIVFTPSICRFNTDHIPLHSIILFNDSLTRFVENFLEHTGNKALADELASRQSMTEWFKEDSKVSELDCLLERVMQISR